MSTEQSVLRGVTNIDLKQTIRKALRVGFEMAEVNGTTHCHLVWPPTGEKVGFGTTVSDRNYYKSFGRQLERISGKEILPTHKHGKVKHNKGHQTFTKTYTPPSQVKWGERIHELISEYQHLVLELKILASAEVSKKDINDALRIIRRMSQIEEFLKELKQPLPEHDLPINLQMLKGA